MENLEKMLVNEIAKLEILGLVYSDMLGPESEEVKALDKKIHELNLQLLDFMVERA
jgi:hypothetical protein